MSLAVSRLKVGDEAFLVASMIDRCPKTMMLRELVQNAIEAARLAPEGHQKVEIGACLINGVPKLMIWNSGPGMAAETLLSMSDIASSIGKVKGLGGNFGMGAKVATLPSNHLGLRFRSNKDGVVSQIILGKFDGIYGRLMQRKSEGDEPAEVIDVSDLAQRDGRDLSHDWTEVVLFGLRPDQNTVLNPYDNNPKVPADWIARNLSERYFDSYPGVELSLLPAVTGRPQPSIWHPRHASLGKFARHEMVETSNGTRLHYLFDEFDPRAPGNLMVSRDELLPICSGVMVIHQNEIYEFRQGGEWQPRAPMFGIAFGAAQISVLIELPAQDCFPDAYRQALHYHAHGQRRVEANDFARLVLDHRPQWLIELIESMAPQMSYRDEVRGELTAMLAEHRVVRRWWPSAASKPKPAATSGAGAGKVYYEPGPDIIGLRDTANLRERGLENKAARYYGEGHQLFLNLAHPSVEKVQSVLMAEHGGVEDQEFVRNAALGIAEAALARRIGHHLVFCLAKRGMWTEWEVSQALSTASLSVPGDHIMLSMDWARRIMRDSVAAFQTQQAKLDAA